MPPDPPSRPEEVPESEGRATGWRATLLLLLTALGRGRIGTWAALLAMALTSVSLGSGLQTEDLFQAGAIRDGLVRLPEQVNVFNYISGGPQAIYWLKDLGTMPWIANHSFQASFWRPLTSLTHQLDYRLLREWPWVMHLHNILAYGLVVVLLSRFYRRLKLTPPAVAIAALIYALNDGHGPVVGWLANRNMLYVLVFGILALHAHDRWRRDGWRPGAVFAPLAFGLAMLSGEAALGLLAYFIAHALVLDEGSWKRRALGLLPTLVVTGVWVTAFVLQGHGTKNIDFYISPLQDPLGYLRELVSWRMPALLLAQWIGLPADAWLGLPIDDRPQYGALGWLGVALVAFVFRWSLPRRRLTAFWVLGSVLAVLPAAIAMPQDRTLMLAGIGASAALAEIVVRGLQRLGQAPWRRSLVVVAVIFVNLMLAPIELPSRTLTLEGFGRLLDRAASTALEGHERAEQHLILVNGPSFFFPCLALTAEYSQHPMGKPPSRLLPRHTRLLYGGHHALTVKRTAPNVLTLSAPESFLTDTFDANFRSWRTPWKAGQGLQLTGLQIRVQEVDAKGRPTRVEFHFQWPLEHERLRFKKFVKGTGYVPFEVPPVGSEVTLPPAE